MLSLSRSGIYYDCQPSYDDEDLRILNRMDEIFTAYPFFGHRRVWDTLLDEQYDIGRDRVLKYMKVLGLETFYPKKKTSIADKQHKIYPYLLRDLEITRPNQVWSIDITYLRMEKGFCYLVAIIDWYSRYILSYRFSNTLDSDFCVAALDEALRKYPSPQIFNSDQGSQFTSEVFTERLLTRGIQISMDGVGRAFDNIIIERFFRTLKHEYVYLLESQEMPQLCQGIGNYLKFYNLKRKHSSLGGKTPFQIYYAKSPVTNIQSYKEDRGGKEGFQLFHSFQQRKKKVAKKKERTTTSTERFGIEKMV